MDKVDIIRAEIERQLANIKRWRDGSTTDEETTFYDGQEYALNDMLDFVNRISFQ